MGRPSRCAVSRVAGRAERCYNAFTTPTASVQREQTATTMMSWPPHFVVALSAEWIALLARLIDRRFSSKLGIAKASERNALWI
jgi:hypothetical protein